jgi:hypothetical protein
LRKIYKEKENGWSTWTSTESGSKLAIFKVTKSWSPCRARSFPPFSKRAKNAIILRHREKWRLRRHHGLPCYWLHGYVHATTTFAVISWPIEAPGRFVLDKMKKNEEASDQVKKGNTKEYACNKSAVRRFSAWRAVNSSHVSASIQLLVLGYGTLFYRSSDESRTFPREHPQGWIGR